MPTLDEILRARQERIDELHRLQPGRTAILVIEIPRKAWPLDAPVPVPAARVSKGPSTTGAVSQFRIR